MRRWRYSIICLVLVVLHLPLVVLAEDTRYGNKNSYTPVYGLAIDKLATRSGPSTAYRETGTYEARGETVSLLSLAYDHNDICWVQCEVSYGGKLRRVYTGVKRFDATALDLGSIQEENPREDQAKVIATSKAMFGPGGEYDTYAELMVDEGQAVTVIAIENDYAQVEWITSVQTYRAWVPVDTLLF